MHSGRCKREQSWVSSGQNIIKVSSLRTRQTFCHHDKLGCAVPQVLCAVLAMCLRKDLLELEVILERSNEKDLGYEIIAFQKETTKAWDPSF